MERHHHPVAGALRSERGAALFAAILAMLLLSTATVAFTILARDEVFISQNTSQAVQAEFASEGGASYGRWMLAQRLRVDLSREVSALSRATMVNRLTTMYNTPAGAAQMLVSMAIPSGAGPTFALCTGSPGGCPDPTYSPIGQIPDAQQVILNLTGTNPTYNTRVIVGVPPAAPPVITNGGTSGLFTYMWRVESTGTAGRASQTLSHDSVIATLPSGTFTIALQSSFVQYAHFIDQMDDTQAWISFRHVYTGPVHTNTRFNILGNPTGPTFRSEATQTLNDVRFNNNGSATTQARDSTAYDWPLLGPSPGILCKSVDCTGFTRAHDFNPATPALDPIPFPAGPNPADRQVQINAALGPTAGCTHNMPAASTCPANAVLVGNTAGMNALAGTLNGGIYVNGNVRDLQLDGTGLGQTLVIYPDATHRTTITENRVANTVTITRECISTAGAPACNGAGAIWQPNRSGIGGVSNGPVVLAGLFSPNVTTDRGVIFVAGTIGVVDTETGLRQRPGATSAIHQDPLTPTSGIRMTVAANGNIWITGHLMYRVDPRGPDLDFDSPLPGGGDDQLLVQNVLGVVSWAGGVRLSSWLSGANLLARYPANGTDLNIHGMLMATNINAAAEPIGQVSFDDPNGPYRGIANLLGGVVQKTMGTFGSPGSPGTGYARNWEYDERFRYRGISPPAFPGFPNFTTATSLGIDSYTWRLGRF